MLDLLTCYSVADSTHMNLFARYIASEGRRLSPYGATSSLFHCASPGGSGGQKSNTFTIFPVYGETLKFSGIFRESPGWLASVYMMYNSNIRLEIHS